VWGPRTSAIALASGSLATPARRSASPADELCPAIDSSRASSVT
jgi:hypothetical protein